MMPQKNTLGILISREDSILQHMQFFLQVPFTMMFLISGKGIVNGEVCMAGLTNSVHGNGRVHDGVGR